MLRLLEQKDQPAPLTRMAKARPSCRFGLLCVLCVLARERNVRNKPNLGRRATGGQLYKQSQSGVPSRDEGLRCKQTRPIGPAGLDPLYKQTQFWPRHCEGQVVCGKGVTTNQTCKEHWKNKANSRPGREWARAATVDCAKRTQFAPAGRNRWGKPGPQTRFIAFGSPIHPTRGSIAPNKPNSRYGVRRGKGLAEKELW